MSEHMSVDRLLRHYEQGEHAALEALGRRLDDTEERLLAQAAAAPERLRGRLDDLASRIHAAKEETDGRAESFREELLSVEPSPDAFRARLVMLEMEHSSRLRLAEEGLRLLGRELEDALLTARARVKEFCDEARSGLANQVGPERLRLVEALAETSRRLASDEEELRRLREEVPLAEARAAERVERLERELAALKAHGAEEIHARRALEAVVAVSKLQAEKAAADAAERAADAAAAAALEQEGLRRRLIEAERALEEARLAAAAALEEAGERRAAGVQLERAAAAVGAERDKVVEQAMAMRRELEKRGVSLEDAKQRVASAETSEKAVRREAAEAAGELRKARSERSSLLERLAGAQEEASAAKLALDAARVDMRSLAETARTLAGRVKNLEEERRRGREIPKTQEVDRGITRGSAASEALLAAELEAQRAETQAWQRRLLEADAGRDRVLGETRAGWAAEKEGYEEALMAKTREITLLRSQLETSERAWQQSLARQDAARMQDIFKLRAEVQKLHWELADAQKKMGPDPTGPA